MGKFYSLGVLLSFLIFPMLNAAGQPQRQAASDLLLRMAAEREQFLTFRVESTVTGVLPDLTSFRQDWKTNNKSRTKIYQEFSRVDQHYITAVCDLDRDKDVWYVWGVSGGTGIRGNSTVGLSSFDADSRPDLRREKALDQCKLEIFDPQAVGLGFFGDFLRATSFENCIAAIISNTRKTSILEVERGETTSTLSYNTDTVIEIATDRGYWPVKLVKNSGGVDEWNVELGKLKHVDVPVHAVLTSIPSEKKEGRITDIRMAWLDVNEPIEIGDSAISRISKKVGAIPKK